MKPAALAAAIVLAAACSSSAPKPGEPPSPAAAQPPAAAQSSAPASPGAARGGATASAAIAATTHVDAASAKAWIDAHPEAVVLDVRTPAEFAAGHVAGATLLDYQSPSFEQDVAALDRTKTYLVHCKSGRRSTAAEEIMRRQGFPSVVHMDGGFDGWAAAGLPVQR